MRKLLFFICVIFVSCGLYAVEMSTTAKAECSKLQNLYSSVKSDYAKNQKLKSKLESDFASLSQLQSVTNIMVNIEKKLNALPTTTTESKSLKIKLLKQLKLGRELKPEETKTLAEDPMQHGS